MSKRYTRRMHTQIGRYQLSDQSLAYAMLSQPLAAKAFPLYVWAVCQDHAMHQYRQAVGRGVKFADIVCMEEVPLEQPMTYKEARDLCEFFNTEGK